MKFPLFANFFWGGGSWGVDSSVFHKKIGVNARGPPAFFFVFFVPFFFWVFFFFVFAKFSPFLLFPYTFFFFS